MPHDPALFADPEAREVFMDCSQPPDELMPFEFHASDHVLILDQCARDAMRVAFPVHESDRGSIPSNSRISQATLTLMDERAAAISRANRLAASFNLISDRRLLDVAETLAT